MKAELLSYFGDDLMIVNAARVSYGKFKEKFDEKDAGLIRYLIKHKHFSPFRHPQLQFRIKCPIFVERQMFKHQISLTANSISGRYVDFSDEYEIPTVLRKQSEDSKQGSGEDFSTEEAEDMLKLINETVNKCKETYKVLCDNGVAKEQARIILPLCLETQYIWTGSLAAFLHMFSLRIKPDAQLETRELAEQMLQQIKEIPGEPFKYTLEAFNF